MKKLRDMLRDEEYDKIWKAYLGFLDLELNEFMEIQNRLLLEQIELLKDSKLGQTIFGNQKIETVSDFRKKVPLTSYIDYADTLLNRREEDLPSKPLYWIQTTWKGGKESIKLAPYSKMMGDENAKMFLSSLILSTSKKRGHFDLRNADKFLYGMAPRPYLTGFTPYFLEDEIDLTYLPSLDEAEQLNFKDRNVVGFKQAIKYGADLFYGVSSVLVKIGESFSEEKGSTKIVFPGNMKQFIKLLKALWKKKVLKKTLLPKDLFEFKGILCGGTDSDTYKTKIKKLFDIEPLEIFGGTESAGVATETWSRNGLTFFPDVNFLEFIPETEIRKEQENPTYKPTTILFNEIEAGKLYELVITKLRGGAFVRYRIGDLIKCIALENKQDQIKLPQIKYIDRVSNVIDLAGFTRITKQIIGDAIRLSKLEITQWTAIKEKGEENPFITLVVETNQPYTKHQIHSLINEHMKQIDKDYNDVHQMLGYDPLKISIVKPGTFNNVKRTHKLQRISLINPEEKIKVALKAS
ncbi:MAG: GH3 auxin-responsive promoter family protein [Candidatus Izimaplasma sp.]|nr:GH3 auxin-responsive promoter family protein [Candidatus Izimaplasma bacterium]